ncbi:hypothetical protein PR202_gb22464 [Eleusine coracana subsp. coracana]|uniref:Uncharacterized protein n=1 Tax=Eleusine coracana subsp. coracana TaxID=191504 RepID=A0AAV5FDU1_ELECO|nr:hypothetical protein PR202_gb22464 [Eleusine coracana subsp. coracana]
MPTSLRQWWRRAVAAFKDRRSLLLARLRPRDEPRGPVDGQPGRRAGVRVGPARRPRGPSSCGSWPAARGGRGAGPWRSRPSWSRTACSSSGRPTPSSSSRSSPGSATAPRRRPSPPSCALTTASSTAVPSSSLPGTKLASTSIAHQTTTTE